MTGTRSYAKFIDTLAKEEFIELFTSSESPGNWFTGSELIRFPFPKNAGSLGVRYLVKRRICKEFEGQLRPQQIEILNDDFGKPEIILDEEGLEVIKKNAISELHCSLSHSRNHLAAVTVFNYSMDDNRRL